MVALAPGTPALSLRILHVADTLPGPDSGAAGTDYQGVKALRRAGHEVVEVWGDQLSRRIKHYNLRYLLELPLSIRAVVTRHLAGRSFDVVQISQPYGHLAAKWIAAQCPQTVCIHRSHGFESRVRHELSQWRMRYPQPKAKHLELASAVMARLLEHNYRSISRHATGHLFSARQCADYMQRVYRVASERCAVIPQAVSSAYLSKQRVADIERLGRVLYVGQNTFFKAPMILGAAISELLVRFPSISFTWVCAAADHSRALAHFIPEVRNRVNLLDWMPQDKLVDVYDRHGLFLFPSFFEGFGKVFLEAMSRGLVVIAADNGGMRDVISHGVDGFKVPTGDVAAMVAQSERVLLAPDLAVEISGHAVATASQFTWDRYASACTEFYERLLRLRGVGEKGR